jgi:Spy/CpxP family protein refolding chaperone
MKRSIIASLALIALLGATALEARGGGKRHFDAQKSEVSVAKVDKWSMFDDLNLTDEQTTTIQQVILDMNYERDTQRLQNPDPKAENLKTALSGGSFDKELFIENAVSGFTTQVTSEASYLESIFSTLSAEQIETLYNNIQ